MWIFLPDSFLSIVDKGDASGRTLLVRARRAGEIERVFPGAEVVEGGGSDYRYRARIDRSEVADRVAQAVRDIDFPNFKGAVKGADRKASYTEVWQAMHRYQQTSED